MGPLGRHEVPPDRGEVLGSGGRTTFQLLKDPHFHLGAAQEGSGAERQVVALTNACHGLFSVTRGRSRSSPRSHPNVGISFESNA